MYPCNRAILVSLKGKKLRTPTYLVWRFQNGVIFFYIVTWYPKKNRETAEATDRSTDPGPTNAHKADDSVQRVLLVLSLGS